MPLSPVVNIYFTGNRVINFQMSLNDNWALFIGLGLAVIF